MYSMIKCSLNKFKVQVKKWKTLKVQVSPLSFSPYQLISKSSLSELDHTVPILPCLFVLIKVGDFVELLKDLQPRLYLFIAPRVDHHQCTIRHFFLPGHVAKQWKGIPSKLCRNILYCNLGHVLQSIAIYIIGEAVSSGLWQVELIAPAFHNLIEYLRTGYIITNFAHERGHLVFLMGHIHFSMFRISGISI